MATDYDVVGIGNALVDVLASVDDAFVAARALDKGGMRLIETTDAETLYRDMPPGMEVSGGSAANSCAGLAALGCRTAFIGRVRDDQLGQVFRHDIAAAGVRFAASPAVSGDPTGRCLVLVTPDGERTMNTYLGQSRWLEEADIDPMVIEASAIAYLEGYQWDAEAPRAALRKAAAVARAAERKVAFTLSDLFLVERHRAEFLAFLDQTDILFANEVELTGLFKTASLDEAVAAVAARVSLAVVTRGAAGALAARGEERVAVGAEPVAAVVDTTGAGDLFAAGFLAGLARDKPLAACLTTGAVAAAEIIGHIGARPRADLAAVVAARG